MTPDGGALAGTVRAAVAGVLLVAWVAWPFLAYGALITATPFFGELPTEQQRARASQLALAAVAVGLLGPGVAAVLVGRGSMLRIVAGVEVVLTLVALAMFLGPGW
jgi:hypothetical protein